VKRHLIALVGALAVLLALGSGVAQAQSVQGVGQTATTGQSATSNASSTQTNPSNSNISVRIFSPGNNGSVSQSNTSAAGSAAINKAATTQAVSQAQSGAGEQGVGQIADTGQEANSTATSNQTKPSNSNIDVRIYSPNDDKKAAPSGGGKVEQSNNSFAGSIAGNKASTEQGVEQEQGGGDKCGCHGSGSGVQAVGQKAITGQEAHSDATSRQEHPKNENISVRIDSPGDNGDVKQSNTSAALSAAGNRAETTQMVGQTQGGGCGCGGDAVQAVGQKAITGQEAGSSATSTQKGASNSNVPVRIKSPGTDGKVEQSNTSLALSAALNAANTTQAVEQEQSGGCKCRPPKKEDGMGHGGGGGGASVQAVGQWAETWQDADSTATSEQFKPSNTNAPVREKSMGGGGSVAQKNTSLAGSLSANLAETVQWVRQDQ
jgi:uncharacterized protein YfiM (DUF2279 family)